MAAVKVVPSVVRRSVPTRSFPYGTAGAALAEQALADLVERRRQWRKDVGLSL